MTVVVLGSAVTLGFLLLPLAFGVDDTLDPRRFALFGIRLGKLDRGRSRSRPWSSIPSARAHGRRAGAGASPGARGPLPVLFALAGAGAHRADLRAAARGSRPASHPWRSPPAVPAMRPASRSSCCSRSAAPALVFAASRSTGTATCCRWCGRSHPSPSGRRSARCGACPGRPRSITPDRALHPAGDRGGIPRGAVDRVVDRRADPAHPAAARSGAEGVRRPRPHRLVPRHARDGRSPRGASPTGCATPATGSRSRSSRSCRS